MGKLHVRPLKDEEDVSSIRTNKTSKKRRASGPAAIVTTQSIPTGKVTTTVELHTTAPIRSNQSTMTNRTNKNVVPNSRRKRRLTIEIAPIDQRHDSASCSASESDQEKKDHINTDITNTCVETTTAKGGTELVVQENVQPEDSYTNINELSAEKENIKQTSTEDQPILLVEGERDLPSLRYFQSKSERVISADKVCSPTKKNSLLRRAGIGYVCCRGLKSGVSPNQDQFAIRIGLSQVLYGVFDGHGPEGHYVSQFVQKRLCDLLSDKKIPNEDEIINAYKQTQSEIIQQTNIPRVTIDDVTHDFDATVSGSTATVCLRDLENGKLTLGHVGDTRAVVGKKDPITGKWSAYDLTIDHKPNLPEELARIKSRGGTVVKYRGDACYRVYLENKFYPGLAMSRAMGDLLAAKIGVTWEPQYIEYTLNPKEDKFLILCSDGVWEFLPSLDAVTIVAESGDPQKAAESLKEKSKSLWLTEDEMVDDITAMVVQLYP